MSEHVESSTLDSSGGLDDLASFLSDTPEEESNEELEANPADEETGEADNSEEASDEQDDDEGEEPEEEPAPVEKRKIKSINDDGSEIEEEVAITELETAYQQRKSQQADYTRKTQALATRESEAVNFLKTKHDEIRNQYLSQAELTRTALVQMAGLKTGEEMAQLAHSDPAAWVAENQRQQSVNAYLSGLDQQISLEKQRAAQEAEAHRNQSIKQQFQKTWEVLEKEKIDKPALAKIYEGVTKTYGFSQEELGNVYDHRLVRMMRDAQAYQALKSQKAVVTKKVSDAPRMPSRQTAPSQERKQQTLERKFTNGSAKLKDLVAYLT